MTDRRLGIGIGLVLGVAAVILFVFVFSDDTVDAPAVDEKTTAQTTTPDDDEGKGPGKQATKPEEPKKPAEPPLATIEVAGGEPVGGVQTLETAKGEQIAFQVISDAADEVHVHGYDVFKDVEAGGKARFSFIAEIDGIFEIELENAGVQIAELRVNP